MAQRLTGYVMRRVFLSSLIVAMVAVTAFAGDATTAPKLGKRLRGRLPAHYGKVVSEEQRNAIYKIQEEYRPKIEALKKQIEALEQQQKEKIAAILTPEQKQEIEQAVVQSQQKRAAAKAKKATPAEATKAEP